MNVGILVECGRQGLEDVVCRRICALLQEHTGVELELEIVPLDNKARLIQDCGAAAAGLLNGGCQRVIILWDERLAWPVKGQPLCWHNDREDILASLRQARLDEHPKVHLVCIEREFESWLLYDERMLSKVLSTDTHRARVRVQGDPSRMSNPKGAMINLFKRHRGWRYVDVQSAPHFARCLDDLARLRGCPTFRRFAKKITGRAI